LRHISHDALSLALIISYSYKPSGSPPHRVTPYLRCVWILFKILCSETGIDWIKFYMDNRWQTGDINVTGGN